MHVKGVLLLDLALKKRNSDALHRQQTIIEGSIMLQCTYITCRYLYKEVSQKYLVKDWAYFCLLYNEPGCMLGHCVECFVMLKKLIICT